MVLCSVALLPDRTDISYISSSIGYVCSCRRLRHTEEIPTPGSLPSESVRCNWASFQLRSPVRRSKFATSVSKNLVSPIVMSTHIHFAIPRWVRFLSSD